MCGRPTWRRGLFVVFGCIALLGSGGVTTAAFAQVTSETGCVNVSTGNPEDCGAPGAVKTDVYNEANDQAPAPDPVPVEDEGGGDDNGTLLVVLGAGGLLLLLVPIGFFLFRRRTTLEPESVEPTVEDEPPAPVAPESEPLEASPTPPPIPPPPAIPAPPVMPGEESTPNSEDSSGLTIRIPKALLIAVAVLLVAGGGVATYLALRSTEVCVSSDSGAEADCDEDGTVSQAEYDQQQAEEAQAEADLAEAKAKAQAAADRCEGQLSDLLTEVRELDSRLAVGLPYADYSRQVGSIRVAYDQVPFPQLSLDCSGDVGIALEDALNSYVKAGNVWGDCIEDFGCDVDGIDPQLQEEWTKASGQLSDATSGLRSLAQP